MTDTLRSIVARSIDWKDAHATFDDAVADFPPALRGVRPAGVPWSAWQLVDHMRVALHDILERNGQGPSGPLAPTLAPTIRARGGWTLVSWIAE